MSVDECLSAHEWPCVCNLKLVLEGQVYNLILDACCGRPRRRIGPQHRRRRQRRRRRPKRRCWRALAAAGAGGEDGRRRRGPARCPLGRGRGGSGRRRRRGWVRRLPGRDRGLRRQRRGGDGRASSSGLAGLYACCKGAN